MMNKTHKIFYEHLISHKYKSILALNGELPDKSFFDTNLPIIAADGAANSLKKINVKPKIIVGDLDTVDPNLLQNTEFCYILDQNKCDFDKALEYAKQSDLLPTIVVGVNGGYIDHILNNISTLISTGGTFYAPPIVGHVLNAMSVVTFSLAVNTKISLIGATTSIVSTNGLKWELNYNQLSFTNNNSYFNRTAKNKVSIEVHSGCCLIMIYLEEINDAGKYDVNL
jgi:thiamine pyrophosphokinase